MSVKINGLKLGEMVYARNRSISWLARQIGAARETVARWANDEMVGLNPDLWHAVVAALKMTDAEVAAVKLADARPPRLNRPKDRETDVVDILKGGVASRGEQPREQLRVPPKKRDAKSK